MREGEQSMIVFGLKCPACGGERLVARHSDSWLTTLPTAGAYVCADCRQPLVFLLSFSIALDNRKFARKKLPPFFLVRFPGVPNQYARIKDISEGGICFNQHYNATPITSRFFKLDLYNCNDGSALEHLPTEIVTTSEHFEDINGIKTTFLNRSARFVDLNQAQRKILLTCLSQYAL
jgi:hypothetical protein